MPPRKQFDLDALTDGLPRIFDEAQSSMATHKKNCVALCKLHTSAASVVETVHTERKRSEVKLVGERAFTDLFVDMINRVLVAKKGPPAADRIVRFVGVYVKFLNEKGSDAPVSSAAADDDETPTTRFISRILKYLLKGFEGKNKTVRYRAVSIVSEMINHLGEMDEDLYNLLRSGLLERLQDKEPLVRVHAVIALAKLALSEDPRELTNEEQPIFMSVVSSLCCDPAPEVRRAALIHIPIVPTILPDILTRTRDVDAVTRKLAYTSLLPRLAHPKQLTIAQRELIVSQGLGDREEVVRLAAAKVLSMWLDLCEGDLADFVGIFDVLTGDVSVDALKSIFVTRPEVFDEIEFDDAFWTNLRPETALLARVFVEHCVSTKDQAKLEASLPVVTAMAFQIQEKYNFLMELMQETEEAKVLDTGNGDDEAESRDDRMADLEFVIGELLRLALHLDFGDEIGRRKMFVIVRTMIAREALSEVLIQPCLGVLEVLSTDERDLVRLAVEVIHELRDPQEGEEAQALDADQSSTTIRTTRSFSRRLQQPEEMTSEERADADALDLRCLNLCIGVLEKVNGTFEENSTLEGILGDLIIPAVKRKELALREKGLVSLGLCCLIARNMAMSSFQLFLNQINSAPEDLKLKVLQVVFDVLMTYEKDFLGRPDDVGERIIAFLMQVLETEESKGVQALVCLGLSKLMLFGLVTDERVLTSLVLAYVSPVTADNHQLRQCLAYFLPVYCFSSTSNRHRMQSIFMTAYDLVVRVYDDLEDDQEVITPVHFGQLFADWTNPQKVASSSQITETGQDDMGLAIDILKALYDSDRTPEDKKILCQILGKLSFPVNPDEQSLQIANILTINLQEQCPFEDLATDKLFLRFRARLAKHFRVQLETFDEQKCFRDEAFRELFEFIGVTSPMHHETSDVEPSEHHAPSSNVHASRRQRSASQSSSEQPSKGECTPISMLESDEEPPESRPPSPRPLKTKGKGKASSARREPSTVKDPEPAIVDSEQKATSRHPATPTRKKTTKRIRSPSQSTVPSPVHKRPHRGVSTNTRTRSKQTAPAPPLSNSTNHSSSSSGKQPMAKNRGQRNQHLDTDESTEDDMDASTSPISRLRPK